MSSEAILLEAIRRKLCVAATYNRKSAVLAPHALFERHGDLFLRAVTVELDGAKPREAKLGTFKLAGLHDVTLTRKLFRPQAELLAGLAANDSETLVVRVA
jgi:hypothetical protein